MSDYDLKVSIKNMGILVPIIKNKRTGHTVDGKHRSDIDPEAPVYEIDIPEELEPLARLAINRCRRDADQNEEEWRDILGKVVGIQGKKPQEIADQTGISLSTIYRHLPQEMKDEKISKGTSEAKQELSQIARQSLSPDKPSLTIPVSLVECDRCHVTTSNPIEWHNHQLCQSCHGKALADPDGFNGYFTAVNKKPETHAVLTTDTPRSLDSWEVRKAQMSPQHSKMEGLVIASLIESGVRDLVQDRHFCVLETIPDIYLPKQNLVIYLDCTETHEGDRLDKDEKLRDLLKKRHGVNFLGVNYDSASLKEVERVTKEILSVVKVGA